MEIKTYKLEDKFSRIDHSNEDAVWFGDPCYVVPGWDHDAVDVWDKLCDSMWVSVTRQHPETGDVFTSREPTFNDKNNIRAVEIETSIVGIAGKFHMWSTSYGDGCFPLTKNHKRIASLGVDAGCLSLIPISLIRGWGTEAAARSDGFFATEDLGPYHLSVEEGDMHWGRYDLLTGDNYNDDDEWDEWGECEECDERRYV